LSSDGSHSDDLSRRIRIGNDSIEARSTVGGQSRRSHVFAALPVLTTQRRGLVNEADRLDGGTGWA
jgi:hypothetical protein